MHLPEYEEARETLAAELKNLREVFSEEGTIRAVLALVAPEEEFGMGDGEVGRLLESVDDVTIHVGKKPFIEESEEDRIFEMQMIKGAFYTLRSVLLRAASRAAGFGRMAEHAWCAESERAANANAGAEVRS